MPGVGKSIALLLIGAGVWVYPGVTGHSQEPSSLHLQNGRISINNQEQPGTFSAAVSRFRFLYFYVPQQGLFIVSNSGFERAVRAGSFDNRELQFEISGLQFTLTSSHSILGKTSQPAWVYYDPGFTLDVKSIMFGYGDSESAPYDWPRQIGKDKKE